ncbi:hypothetical protein DRH14_00185 [Candidatus Shapirobacteria bacterium]|nr:MAG: hypothetical protein DRH14_00185 [Candidatus Shapirobacteria bacterium]
MKKEIIKHSLPILVIFLLTSVFWFFHHQPYYLYFHLFLGLSLGTFFIDIDHFLYWFLLQPQLEESRLAKLLIKQKQYKKLFQLLEATHDSHQSLIFHHLTTQITLVLLATFVLSSTNSPFAIAFLIATSIHLSIDQIHILFRPNQSNKQQLQQWLFARLPIQLPTKYLPHYVTTFLAINLIFIIFLFNFNL